ncbi:endonuclease domain-containing protein [Paraburkholderia fungorum]|uniref:endonuclease domain-containing protein n=1 Tax=Paraburkholderia fungorum TaxID=134537 RepID=UPI000697E18E|nr:endonuclease domain-containing protein [Paraburkholderia fungorum]MBB5546343.1 hypothetical protein [Paraburkholderia fungorum]
MLTDKPRYNMAGADTTDHRRVGLLAQSGLCAICAKKITLATAASDHCHRTNMVRGVLCKPCNGELGHWEAGRAVPAKFNRRPRGAAAREAAARRYLAYWHRAAANWQGVHAWIRSTWGQRTITDEQVAEGFAALAQAIQWHEIAPPSYGYSKSMLDLTGPLGANGKPLVPVDRDALIAAMPEHVRDLMRVFLAGIDANRTENRTENRADRARSNWPADASAPVRPVNDELAGNKL